ncbi:MAG: hypothetical protein EPN82_14265 [Bacteroidetes bacterium]|nr:MAG: hypothetical protein EPN82_14265 [Bacteroidota bacterium]
MKSKNKRKRNRKIAGKIISGKEYITKSGQKELIEKLENLNIEIQREEEINTLLDKFIKDSMEYNLINEFEAGDIKFLINDYLAEHGINEIPEYIMTNDNETNDDF